MPRKKKSGQSPARVPIGLQQEGVNNTGFRAPPMARHFLLPGSSVSAKEDIVRNMREMFSHLDPEVIYIVLSECDFKVENAMDALLELSVAAAADPQPASASESGFERTAAELLTPHHFSEPQAQSDQSTDSQHSPTSPSFILTEELDFLIDQELQSLSAQENITGQPPGGQTETEDLKSHLEPLCSRASTLCLQSSGDSSSLDTLSTFDDTHLTEKAPDTKPQKDFIKPGASSAFQVYSKPKDINPAEVMVSAAAVASSSYENRQSSASLTWNIDAPAFQPHVLEPPGSAFITPVACDWPRGPSHTLPWHRPNSRAHLRPPTIPRCCALPPPQPSGQSYRLRLEGRVLVLLRGPPGSGKSTLARALLEHHPCGVILSTDDYFLVNGEYCFDSTVLGEAHSWNHNRARLAFERGVNPIIIDNTNLCGWEMRPYVVQALKHGYKVLFREPDTWWKNKPRELERRTKHGVPLERIRRMLCGYERFVSVKSILGSQMPERKQAISTETKEPLELQGSCPDTVGESTETNAKAHAETVSSQPDVSTTHSTECFQDKHENTDAEMEELVKSTSDSIVEPVSATDLDELPVAFSTSIGQRTKREQTHTMSNVDNVEPADQLKDGNTLYEKVLAQQSESTAEKYSKSVVQSFDFEGDWPTTASLEQRQDRRHERVHDKATMNNSGAANPCIETKDVLKPDLTELQKLFDLIQTGVVPANTDYSSISPLSGSSEDIDIVSSAHGSQFEMKEGVIGELPDCVSDSQAAKSNIAGEKELHLGCGASHNTTSYCDIGEASDSTEFESLGGSESSPISNVSGCEEHKQHQTRRLGKQCKLALTFTQNHPETSVDCAENVAAVTSDDKPNTELKTNVGLCTESNMMAEYEAPSSLFTQTESHDFALLWRVNQNGSDASHMSNQGLRILCGSPTRFLPLMCRGAASVDPTNHNEIPYSVVHEKSTQVVEEEFGTSKDVTENLLILRSHFKQVALDTLEDLYEKCQRDLQWTTNLLLDSGERFYRDDENDEEEGRLCAECEDETSSDVLNIPQYEELTSSGPDVVVEEIQTSTTSETWQKCDSTAASSSLENVLDDNFNMAEDKNNVEDNILPPQMIENPSNLNQNTEPSETRPCEAADFNLAGAEGVEGSAVEMEDGTNSMNEIHRILQVELEELEREEKEREDVKARMKDMKQKKKQLMDIKSVELNLPTELALQLTELFGPVGVDPDTGSPEDYVIQMDLNMAKLIHQKWKESIQERQKQAALSFRLLQESSVHWGKPQLWTMSGPSTGQRSRDRASHQDRHRDLPFMDHWNVSQQHVSLRDIIKEEMVLQKNRDKVRQSQTDVDKRDGATLLKEDQLFALFPMIDRHFLQDIFKDHNYSLTQTELFLRSLLGEGPVKTVIAPEAPQITHPRSGSKDREKKPVDPVMPSYQDIEDPEYQDFRVEANLQRRRQLENFAKAAEAYKQGHKEVASFYAQQGHLHGQRMREANHRAAVQIFERVNSSLLPQNILDLHGLHVDEALERLAEVLAKKTTEYERGLCRPQLSVITGRGNHSHRGVARIRPAVLDYLNNRQYRFTESKPGLVLVSLK